VARILIDGHCIVCRRVDQTQKTFKLCSTRASSGHGDFSYDSEKRMPTEDDMHVNIGLILYLYLSRPCGSARIRTRLLFPILTYFGITCAEKSGPHSTGFERRYVETVAFGRCGLLHTAAKRHGLNKQVT